MEANVVDAVVRGDVGPELQSQAAALNWDATASATVIVGLPQADRTDLASDDVHDVVTRNGRAALSDVHGTWLVAIVSGSLAPTDRFLTELLGVFADGPVVIGPTAPTLGAAYVSATEAIAGMNAVAGWSGAPRPVSARELLPERALLGDVTAISALEGEVMRPLADAGPALSETLDAYLDSGGAIEACARKLFVHPNPVRSRLTRIADFTGRDPTLPRDAYVLRVATTVGRLSRQAYQPSTSNPASELVATPRPAPRGVHRAG
jgi:DNA-binding PucR family transcriptional regulator